MTIIYKGYSPRLEWDEEKNLWFGRVIGLVGDVITCYGPTIEEAVADFRISIDEYLAFCVEQGVAPEKPLNF